MSDTTSSSFTKICASCGLEKPLSAFLELSGEAAGTYGSICGTCRKTHMEKLKSKEKEDSSRTETGHKIDSKVKVASDIDKKQTAERVEEEYHKERDEEEIVATDALEKIDIKKAGERKHRENFLDRRRAQPNQKADENTKTHVAVQQETRERQNTQDYVREEAKKTEIDLTTPVIDTIIPKKKFEGIAIRAFANLARNSAIGNRLGNKLPETDANKSKDPTLSEFAEKLWGPKKR